MKQLKNFLIKRVQSQARMGFAECEKSRLLAKTFMTLVALLAVTTQAWAYPIVYDFEAAVKNGVTISSKNGSAANGQMFYGWESKEKPDVPRQDYKGYELSESNDYLPRECHVWRRSDRMPENNSWIKANGGLTCPSNKEMAIDGLELGCRITIIYDATNAAEGSKEIMWAIGDGSSESLTQARATATINGTKAVPGETTIKSGDVITVNSLIPAENGTGYIVFKVMKGMVIKKITIDAPLAGTPVNIVPVEGKTNEWTLTVPAGNVTVNVDYYQPATIDGSLAANNGVPATTDEPLVVAEGASFTVSGGTLLFAFGENDQTAPELDSDAWTEDYPTAEDIAEAGTAYVWYYVKGQDGDAPRSNTAPQCITVQIADAPTYNVTFAESTPEPDKWSAQPNEGLKKGDKVTVTYTGQKKVIGVKAEKKAAPKLLNFSPMGQIFYYYEGETWGQAIQNHPENAANGWYIEEFGITIMYKGRALCDSAHDDDITKDTVVNPNGGYLWGPEP